MKKRDDKDDEYRKSMKDINGVRDDDIPVVTIIQPTTSSSSSLSSSVLAQLSKQPVSDTRGSFDKLHKYITVSDLRELSVMIGEGKLNRHHRHRQRKAYKKNVALTSFDRRSSDAGVLDATTVEYNDNLCILLTTAAAAVVSYRNHYVKWDL